MLREDAARLAVPTFFVRGDADAFAPREREGPGGAHADARFEVVADAGHLPHLDRPDAVAAALVDFLDRRRRERAGRRATR